MLTLQNSTLAGVTCQDVSACSVAANIAASGVPLQLASGWLDTTASAAIHAYVFGAHAPGGEQKQTKILAESDEQEFLFNFFMLSIFGNEWREMTFLLAWGLFLRVLESKKSTPIAVLNILNRCT